MNIKSSDPQSSSAFSPRTSIDTTAEETPERLAAIDEGLRSLKENGVTPIEDVRKKLSQWATSTPLVD